jgi:hypothetical protein
MAFQGFLDGVTDGRVYGWAFDSNDPDQGAEIDVFVDDEWVATVAAELFRADLRDHQIGEGRHGFSHDLPLPLLDGRAHLVSARWAGTTRELSRSPARVILGEPPAAPAGTPPPFKADRPIAPLIAEIKNGGRLAIIASFLRKPRLLGYHRVLARSLRALGFKVAVVQNVLEPFGDPAFEADVDLFIARGNAGFDFGAWLTLLDLLGDAAHGLVELVLVNDSVFGPLFDLAPVFAKMNRHPADVWGITDSWDRAYHLQSYFLVFKRAALESPVLMDFRRSYEHPASKSGVIERGEVALTQTLLAEGLKVAAYCPYREVAASWLGGLAARVGHLRERPEIAMFAGTPGQALSGPDPGAELRNYQSVVLRLRRGLPVNPTHTFWDALIETFGCPFIKRDLLFFNPTGVPNLGDVGPTIRRLSSYPLDLIEEARGAGPVRLAQPIFLPAGTS